jgi:superfamily I DNA/RNA helicase
LDEFQDTNKVCLDIFLNQKHAQLIAVGDPYQSIYAFRGAVNAFEYIPDTFLKLKLSSSFRFTPEVAELAKKAIRLFGDEIDVIGEASTGSISTRAVICRTNIGVLKEILSYGDKGLKVYSNINLKETFAKLFHIEAVMFGNKPKFPVKEFAYYNDFKDIKKASEVDQDIKSLLDILNFIKGKHSGVFAFKKSIEETLVKESLADVTISTCHKVKGLEYDSVTLSEDFCKLPKDMEIEFWLSGLDVQEYNLIYIGITRGKFEVKLPEVLQIVLKEPRKWKDKADTARELRKKMLFAA